VPPKPGVDLPEDFVIRVMKDGNAFQFERAWIGKTQRVKRAREAYTPQPGSGGLDFATLPTDIQQTMVVSGTLEVAVIMIKYANTGADPYPTSALQAKLFDGPNPTGTMSEFYSEMSYGNLNMTGTVYPVSPSGWVQALQNDTYYEGGQNGLHPCVSRTGQLILEALQATDPTVDFGKYDNDGPDGIANSGDDDGFVDFVAIVQPEIGGECGTRNIWSHRWVVGAWREFGARYVGSCQMAQVGAPWTTNDASANGGFVKIWDYTIQPAKGSGNGCGNGTVEIGVFSHEFGHAFGLPDLYDTNGGGQGIGVHGLMGSGNWNSPSNPAHMSAWSKLELGWLPTMEVGPVTQAYTINNINQTPEVYRLNTFDEKFARSSSIPISGGSSFRCGLDAVAAAARNWPGGAGYGNGWHERIQRDFAYDGTDPVTLQYDVWYDIETNYDFGRIKIEVGGIESELIAYTGFGLLNDETIDLTPYLSGAGATGYRIIAELETDNSYSDEDGNYNSGFAGPFKLDNISVTGGGEGHSTGFEDLEDGWYYTTEPTEFFLVENRSKAGRFDQALRSEGLYIWHIEQNVAHSALGNSGGTSGRTNLRPAGVTLMEADGRRHLLRGVNWGDTGDAYPGSWNNRLLDNGTNPNSKSHNNSATQVVVDAISNAGAVMTATMTAGRVAPEITAIIPNTGFENLIVPITDLTGSSFVHGATLLLRGALATEYPAAKTEWVGKSKLTGELDLTDVPPGSYDVVVRNPDGQEAVLSAAFVVIEMVALDLKPGSCPNPFNTKYFEFAAGTNLRKGGVFPVAVLGDDNFDPSDIDISTIRLEGVEPLTQGGGPKLEDVAATLEDNPDCLCTDDGPDGFVDLKMKFSTLELAAALASGTRGEERVLTITGELLDGTLFMGTDCVVLVGPQVADVTPTTQEPILNMAFPNPFNPATRISYVLPERTAVTLAIYDVQGKLVETLVSGAEPVGEHVVEWNATGRPSGIYFYRLTAGTYTETRKMVLLK